MNPTNGKGSSPRPMKDRDQFEANHEAIFGKKEKPRPVFEPIEGTDDAGKTDR
jgi:hypothetical protein